MPIGNIPVPPENIESEPTVQICINKGWANVLIGQIWGLRYPEAWGGTLEENRRARGEIKNLINMLMGDEECGSMSKCCVEVAITFRISVTTGMIEQSADNGATWQPAAGGINQYIVEPIPPVTNGTAGTKCDAATNLSGQVEQWITQVSGDFDTATSLLEFAEALILAIAGAVLTILSAGALSAVEALLLSALGAAIIAMWGAGKAVFDAYWTTENKDKILCAAYCNIGDDGSFTDAQFSAFWNDCNSQLPPSPAKMLFMGFLSSVGRQGVNAMAASGIAADADCADCICFPSCADDWEIRGDLVDYCTIVERGEDFITLNAHTPLSNGVYYADIRSPNLSTCCYFDHYEDISGSVAGIAATECGQDLAPVGGLWTGHCIWILQPQGSAAFTAKFFLTECP